MLLGEMTFEFPSRRERVLARDLGEAERVILRELAWFIWRLGVVGARPGEGEPVVVVNGEWEALSGAWRSHDNSVECTDQVVVERNQRLTLASPKEWTGIDERLLFSR
jgi:hypothetical protein